MLIGFCSTQPKRKAAFKNSFSRCNIEVVEYHTDDIASGDLFRDQPSLVVFDYGDSAVIENDGVLDLISEQRISSLIIERLPKSEFFSDASQFVYSIIKQFPALFENPNAIFDNTEDDTVTLIASSTGGPGTILRLLAGFDKKKRRTLVIAQHIDANNFYSFCELIKSSASYADIQILTEGATIKLNHINIVHPHVNLIMSGETIECIAASSSQVYYPEINQAICELVRCFGNKLEVMVLTGMGNDGALSISRNFKKLGNVYVQKPSECEIPTMVEAVINLRLGAEVLSVKGLAERI